MIILISFMVSTPYAHIHDLNTKEDPSTPDQTDPAPSQQALATSGLAI